MEFILLAFALAGLVIPIASVHILLFLAHAAFTLPLAWRLLRTQPLTAMFLASYVLMYFPNPLAVLLGWIPSGPNEAPSILYPSNALILIGLDLFIFGARRLRFSRPGINQLPPLRVTHTPLDLCIAVCLVLCTVSAIVLVSGLGVRGINVFTVGKTGLTMSREGGYNMFYMVANYAFLTLPLAVFLIGLKRFALHLPYLLPIAMLLVFHFMVFRVRSSFVAVLIAYMIATAARTFVVSMGTRRLKHRLALHVKLALLAGIPFLIFFIVAFKYVRHSYMIRDYDVRQERVEDLLADTFSSGDLGYAFFTRRAFALFPDVHPYLYGQSYYRLLFIPIPRSLWPGKPENTQRIFARIHDRTLAGRGTTIPPGIVGDLYINFGKFGVIGMIVWGAIFARERYRRFSDLVFVAGSGLWLFHIVRGSVTVPLMFMVVIWIFALFFQKIIRPQVIVEIQGVDAEPGLPPARAPNALPRLGVHG